MGDFAQFGKADRRVDEIAKDDLSRFHVAGEKIVNPLAQKHLTKSRDSSAAFKRGDARLLAFFCTTAKNAFALEQFPCCASCRTARQT
jgi:hypothetical protein